MVGPPAPTVGPLGPAERGHPCLAALFGWGAYTYPQTGRLECGSWETYQRSWTLL